MNFAVLGGDERSVCLVRRLRQDGHEVRTFGMECAMEQERGPAGLDEVLEGTECVILPIPLERKPGLLNAPFGETEIPLGRLFDALPGDVPVFAGVGGGYTNGQRSVNMAAAAEQQGAFGVVCNALITNEAIRDIKSTVEIPLVFTVVSEHVDLEKRLSAGVDIVNVSGATRTPDIVAEIRAKYPELPIIATGGPTDETILAAIRAGANAITYTPPSSKDLFAKDMQEYRDWYESHRGEVEKMLNE